jgi:orotidine-5'-phosphate decarboxylase
MNGSRHAELCAALDGSDRRWILDTARLLVPEVDWLKIGLEAFAAHGPALVAEVAEMGCRVFLDVKLHDIPTTVRRAAANCAATGAGLLTVHASGGRAMLEAAAAGVREGAPGKPPKLAAVTVLTSIDSSELAELGLHAEPEELVLRWARLAQASGVGGVVASAREASRLRAGCGSELYIVTPGIRPDWHSSDDQRRVLKPAEAVRCGADLLVVGRPITRHPAPPEAARRIAEEMATAAS